MRLRRTAAATAVILAAASGALAQPPPGGRPEGRAGGGRGAAIVFELADRDRDGRVTLAEAWAFVEAGFAAADANRDGSLTLDETGNFRPDGAPPADPGRQRPGRPGSEMWREPLFRGLDANRDRRLQLEELRPLLEAFFRSADLNYDGVITRDEIPSGG